MVNIFSCSSVFILVLLIYTVVGERLMYGSDLIFSRICLYYFQIYFMDYNTGFTLGRQNNNILFSDKFAIHRSVGGNRGEGYKNGLKMCYIYVWILLLRDVH